MRTQHVLHSDITVCELTREEVDLRRLRPREAFVARIAENVARKGDVRKPGFVVIPNTRDVFASRRSQSSTWRRVRMFQRRLMRCLDEYLQQVDPEALRHQNYLDLPPKVAERHYSRAQRGIRSFVLASGPRSIKFWHMDVLSHIFVSLCYGPTRNITGGTPQFLDLLRMEAVLGHESVYDLIELQSVKRITGGYLYHPRERAAKLLPRLRSVSRDFVVRISGLDRRKMPMVVFTNRLENGIMHGATRARKKDDKRRDASRPISYVAIGHR